MKKDILALLEAGKTYAEIVTELGCTKATISYHAKRAGKPRQSQTRHDWKLVQDHHDQGHGVVACMRKFGFARKSWYDAVRRGDVTPRPENTQRKKFDLDALLVEGSAYSRVHLKARLIKEGHLTNECSECCQGPIWRDKPMTLVLDHRNGIYNDNRLQNLRLLCPNCNSQTETFAGRNRRYKK